MDFFIHCEEVKHIIDVKLGKIYFDDYHNLKKSVFDLERNNNSNTYRNNYRYLLIRTFFILIEFWAITLSPNKTYN